MTDAELRRVAKLVAAELDPAFEEGREAVVRVLVGSPFPGRVALSPQEAAGAIGCSRDYFDEHLGPHLRWFRSGKLKFVAVTELCRFLEKSSALTIGGEL